MERKTRFLKRFNWVLAGLLAVLGFNVSCDNQGGEEYGTPHADFTVKGKVKDQADVGIKGIQVVVGEEDRFYNSDTVRTDSEGNYMVTKGVFPLGTIKIVATDIDGEENGGTFAADSTAFSYTYSDFSGGKNWYEGKATKTIDFTLKKKENE